ncbi:serine/threonine-protein kinase [Sandaracinobacteroides saxicola]|uniref:Serine/threonine protein kinase n=1 Tax=Sandaracinobacteroides saxicola TaxID=2759707 RepID=A0A7G5IJ17_9SPHN|nr:serine/threonine-protein kinase [Sandaracinobacteroides saxicola]QMW23359.1 serine/threonine protein kinase [Sandaracinobacteroides saxicola]
MTEPTKPGVEETPDPFGGSDPFGVQAPADAAATPPTVPPVADMVVPPAAAERTVIASEAEIAAALAAARPAAPPTPAPLSVPPAALVSAPQGAPLVAHGSPGALVGTQLNDLFEIVRFIAQGGMGIVYEGRNIHSGERVAIKVILPQYAADQQFMALFRREASALERIGHDALVKYRTLAFDRGTQINYLAIEYVDGPSMADALSGEPTDPAVVKRVLRRLAQGLGAAHEAGVIHRDLSPDNVLLPGGNIERAKIIDFGIAKDTNPGEKSVVGDAFAGKFGYAAPEIFGKYGRKIGPWSDIYSLALVIAALARGTPIDMGITIVDALDARAAVPDLSDIAPELQPVLAKMLAPDPADRFQTMDEVADAADPRGATMFMAPVAPQVAAAEPVPEPARAVEPVAAFVRAETPVAAAPEPRKGRGLLYGGIGAAVVVLGVAGFLLSSGGDEKAPEAPATAVEAPAAAPPWASAQAAVAAALRGVACADLRVSGTPVGGSVRLTGWRAAGSALPANAGGWAIDGSGVLAVETPSAETCRLIDGLRAAVPTAVDARFAMAPDQKLSLATMPKDGSGGVLVDLQVRERPPGRALIATIDDKATSAANRVVSGDVETAGVDLARIPFDPKTSRYLIALVSSTSTLEPVTAEGPPASLRAACIAGGCTLTSGWVEIRE